MQLARLLAGGWIPHAIHAAASLGIADALGAGATTARDVALRVDADADGVLRLLRSLAGIGICRALDGDRFELTAVGDCLRRDSSDSLRSWALLVGDDMMRHSWDGLTSAVRTGRRPGELPEGFDPFEFLAAQRPGYADTFYAAMAELTRLAATTVVDAYDFTPFRRIVDVGGGNGALLAATLKAAPGARGVLVDLPHRRDAALAIAEKECVSNRWTFQAGNFFDAVPPGGDLYLLKSVLHDWDDEQSHRVLRCCRESMSDTARLLIVEMVIRDPVRPSARNTVVLGTDLNLLATLSGRERTLDEFRVLLTGADLRLLQVSETSSAFDVMEAVRA